MSQPVPVPGRAPLVGTATGRTLEEHYEILDVLGRGSFSVVHRARHRQTDDVFACKLIDKWSIHNRQRLANEIEVLQRVTHPSVIRLHDIFETDRFLALITDIAGGGELFDRIVDKGHYSEKEASEVIARLLHAIDHLHRAGIVHRDIKPENILLEGPESAVDVKLSDFGLAKIFSGDEAGSAPDQFHRARAFTVCGTDYYVAPEVLQQAGYTQACDLWSVGVVLYILLSGCPPFYEGGEEGISVQRKIIAGKYSFPDRYWGQVSPEAKDLVTNLLQTDPARRFTVQQALGHAWIRGNGVSVGQLPVRNVESLRTFNNKRKNSVAGSPLVGSYSVFGSVQSPAEASFHMPGKHRRLGASIPHSHFAGGPACGSVPEGGELEGGRAPAPSSVLAGGPGGQGLAADGFARPQASRVGGLGASLGGSLGAGSFGGAGMHAAHQGSYGMGGLAAPGGMSIPGAGGGAGPGSGGCGGGMPIPGAARARHHGQQDVTGSLSASPPTAMLSASPNPGAAFLMEM